MLKGTHPKFAVATGEFLKEYLGSRLEGEQQQMAKREGGNLTVKGEQRTADGGGSAARNKNTNLMLFNPLLLKSEYLEFLSLPEERQPVVVSVLQSPTGRSLKGMKQLNMLAIGSLIGKDNERRPLYSLPQMATSGPAGFRTLMKMQKQQPMRQLCGAPRRQRKVASVLPAEEEQQAATTTTNGYYEQATPGYESEAAASPFFLSQRNRLGKLSAELLPHQATASAGRRVQKIHSADEFLHPRARKQEKVLKRGRKPGRPSKKTLLLRAGLNGAPLPIKGKVLKRLNGTAAAGAGAVFQEARKVKVKKSSKKKKEKVEFSVKKAEEEQLYYPSDQYLSLSPSSEERRRRGRPTKLSKGVRRFKSEEGDWNPRSPTAARRYRKKKKKKAVVAGEIN